MNRPNLYQADHSRCRAAVRRLLIAAALCVPLAACEKLFSPIRQLECTNRYPDGTSHQFPSLIFNKDTGQTYRFDSFTEKLIPDNRVYDYDSQGRLEVLPDMKQTVLEAGGKIKHRLVRTEIINDKGESVKESIQIIEFDKSSLKVLSNIVDDKAMVGAELKCKWAPPKTIDVMKASADNN